jgi:hypothetical protein
VEGREVEDCPDEDAHDHDSHDLDAHAEEAVQPDRRRPWIENRPDASA